MSCRERGSVSEVLCESHWSGVKSGRAGLEQTVADWLWSAGHLSCALKTGGGSCYLLTDGARPAEIDMTGFPFLDEQLSFSFTVSVNLFAPPSTRIPNIFSQPFLRVVICRHLFIGTIFSAVHSATANNLFTCLMT